MGCVWGETPEEWLVPADRIPHVDDPAPCPTCGNPNARAHGYFCGTCGRRLSSHPTLTLVCRNIDCPNNLVRRGR